jgi:acyl-CoA reductase-like NAD-dependent aldehyde dehydrogenase
MERRTCGTARATATRFREDRNARALPFQQSHATLQSIRSTVHRGRWRSGRSDRANRDLNPWTGETVAEISQATRDDLDEAYAAAKEAQRGWAAMLPTERCINQSQFDRLMRRIDEARTSGARELVGGSPRGLVLPPHVFADVANDNPLAREEIFGPVAPLIRATDEEHALQLANDTQYGLSSASDLERGLRFARQVGAGMTHVNDQPVNDLPFSPFGGEKNSAIGRFNGRWAIDAFTTDHWITVQHVPRRYPADARELQGPWAGG